MADAGGRDGRDLMYTTPPRRVTWARSACMAPPTADDEGPFARKVAMQSPR